MLLCWAFAYFKYLTQWVMPNIEFFNAFQYHILYNKGINSYGGTTMKTIHIEFSDERLITPSGLVFVGQILGKSNFVKRLIEHLYQMSICKSR